MEVLADLLPSRLCGPVKRRPPIRIRMVDICSFREEKLPQVWIHPGSGLVDRSVTSVIPGIDVGTRGNQKLTESPVGLPRGRMEGSPSGIIPGFKVGADRNQVLGRFGPTVRYRDEKGRRFPPGPGIDVGARRHQNGAQLTVSHPCSLVQRGPAVLVRRRDVCPCSNTLFDGFSATGFYGIDKTCITAPRKPKTGSRVRR